MDALNKIDSKRTEQSEKAALSHIDNFASIPKFSFDKTTHVARVLRIIDGDTIEIAMFHEGAPRSFHVRLLGIDAPEMKPLKSNPDRDAIKREALAARAALFSMLPEGSFCKLDCGPFCKFGRILATVYTENGININEALVEQGFVVGDAVGRTEWDVLWPHLQQKRNEYAQKKAANDVKIFSQKEQRRAKSRRFCFCCRV